jgi:hypothetical protein
LRASALAVVIADNPDRRDGSGFRWAATFGERQSLHVGRVLKDTCALQSFASCRAMRHGSCLLKRHERFHTQVPLGPIRGLPLVHLKRLGESVILCLFSSRHWNLSSQIGQEPNDVLAASQFWRCPMSKEKPTDDPRQQTDWGSHKQTDKPWRGNPEKEQRPGSSKPDLEKWHETNTH